MTWSVFQFCTSAHLKAVGMFSVVHDLSSLAGCFFSAENDSRIATEHQRSPSELRHLTPCHSGESDQIRVAQHGEQQHLRSGGRIVLRGVLCLVVADTAFTGNENHACGCYPVDVTGVVTGT